MNEIMEDNMLKILYNNLIRESLALWSKCKSKSFVWCFKTIMKEKNFKWEESGLNIRYILRKAINYLNSTTIAQIICYSYEIILLDNNTIDIMKENAIFKKAKGIDVYGDINNDYQLINFIRNAISHNNDLGENLYIYSDIDETYTFRLNKEGQENSKIIINKNSLIDFLYEYVHSSELYKKCNTELVVYLKNMISDSTISKDDELMNIKSSRDIFIVPDENQKKVIDNLVRNIRESNSIDFEFIKLHYPYKQNVVNNYFNAIDFYCLMEEVYSSRGSTFLEYIDNVVELGMLKERKLILMEDLMNMFMVNRVFQIFSTNNNQFINESLKGVIDFQKYNKLRNAIIHGTYYIDFKGNLYFYDAPRSKKTEEELNFVDVFSRNDFITISNAFCSKKYDKKNQKK